LTLREGGWFQSDRPRAQFPKHPEQWRGGAASSGICDFRNVIDDERFPVDEMGRENLGTAFDIGAERV
jgi:hypothetical protein